MPPKEHTPADSKEIKGSTESTTDDSQPGAPAPVSLGSLSTNIADRWHHITAVQKRIGNFLWVPINDIESSLFSDLTRLDENRIPFLEEEIHADLKGVFPKEVSNIILEYFRVDPSHRAFQTYFHGLKDITKNWLCIPYIPQLVTLASVPEGLARTLSDEVKKDGLVRFPKALEDKLTELKSISGNEPDTANDLDVFNATIRSIATGTASATQFVVIMGHTGSGKSAMLRYLAPMITRSKECIALNITASDLFKDFDNSEMADLQQISDALEIKSIDASDDDAVTLKETVRNLIEPFVSRENLIKIVSSRSAQIAIDLEFLESQPEKPRWVILLDDIETILPGLRLIVWELLSALNVTVVATTKDCCFNLAYLPPTAKIYNLDYLNPEQQARLARTVLRPSPNERNILNDLSGFVQDYNLRRTPRMLFVALAHLSQNKLPESEAELLFGILTSYMVLKAKTLNPRIILALLEILKIVAFLQMQTTDPHEFLAKIDGLVNKNVDFKWLITQAFGSHHTIENASSLFKSLEETTGTLGINSICIGFLQSYFQYVLQARFISDLVPDPLFLRDMSESYKRLIKSLHTTHATQTYKHTKDSILIWNEVRFLENTPTVQMLASDRSWNFIVQYIIPSIAGGDPAELFNKVRKPDYPEHLKQKWVKLLIPLELKSSIAARPTAQEEKPKATVGQTDNNTNIVPTGNLVVTGIPRKRMVFERNERTAQVFFNKLKGQLGITTTTTSPLPAFRFGSYFSRRILELVDSSSSSSSTSAAKTAATTPSSSTASATSSTSSRSSYIPSRTITFTMD